VNPEKKMNKNIELVVHSVVSEIFYLDTNEIELCTNLKDLPGFDSLKFFSLYVLLCDKVSPNIDISVFASIETMEELCAYLTKLE